MKKTLGTREAANMLLDDENARWSRAGAYAIIEYLESVEDDTGEEIEFDRVAIRCEYNEYNSLIDWAMEYFGTENTPLEEFDLDPADDPDEETINDAIRDYINDHGQLIEFDGGVIVSSF